jgi:hypothetical protein
MDRPYTLRVMRAGLSSGQALLSTTIFESSRCRLNVEAMRVAKDHSV